jgi:hypothetical protein
MILYKVIQVNWPDGDPGYYGVTSDDWRRYVKLKARKTQHELKHHPERASKLNLLFWAHVELKDASILLETESAEVAYAKVQELWAQSAPTLVMDRPRSIKPRAVIQVTAERCERIRNQRIKHNLPPDSIVNRGPAVLLRGPGGRFTSPQAR